MGNHEPDICYCYFIIDGLGFWVKIRFFIQLIELVLYQNERMQAKEER